MEYKVININGEETGRSISFSDNIAVKPNDHCIYLDVKQYLANQRQGTHKSKERAEIKGSTKKLKKQKGTGAARFGSIKSPIFRGGGRTFGPRPRNYSFKLNKKVKALARLSAFNYKLNNQEITVIEDFSLEKPETKKYLSILTALSLHSKKTLLVLPEQNQNIYLSSRNLKRTKIILPQLLNTYDLLNADQLIIFESSVEKINDFLKRK